VFSSGGDTFSAAFGNPTDAVAAALDAQRRQLREPVGEAGPLNVRMAIHSGVAGPHNGDYRSPSVYRAHRLVDLVRGSQVLLSQATRELLGGRLAPDASLRALGAYRLRGLEQPEEMFQLLAPDLPDDSELDRVLVTILFTDIVDSTATAAQLGDRRWRSLIASHHALMRDSLPRFRGREIRTTGDGIFAVFNTPTQAIECAVALREGVSSLGMQIRAGIHTGECELVGDELEGLAVHVAARVAAIAEAAEVLVSSTVTELVAGSGTTFAPRGTHIFKGVPGEWRILTVTGTARSRG
jgi:class 3 adenylate cyclase